MIRALWETTLADFVAAARERAAGAGRVRVPVLRALPADLHTPLGAWLRVRGGRSHSFLFESIEGGERLARWSFLGTRPSALLRSWPGRTEIVSLGDDAGPAAPLPGDPRDALRAWLRDAPLAEARVSARCPGGLRLPAPSLPPFLGGAVGFFAYDSVRLVERIPRGKPDPLGTPDLDLALHEELLAFDHLRSLLWLVRTVVVDRAAAHSSLESAFQAACSDLDGREAALRAAAPAPSPAPATLPATPPTWHPSVDRASFHGMVARAQEHIRAGDIFQVVLSRRNSARVSCHPVSVYRALRVLNPSPYLFLLELGEHTLAGASPEMLVRVRGRHAETLPIAGTRRRGATEEEDAALERELLADAKELAEHEMLVDLGRNDLGRVCRFGSVRLAEHKTVHRFSHVMHIVSRVEGELREGVDALDALYACFPAGTVSGAPKVRAMQIVEDLEPSARGVYAGAVGYMDFRGDLDTCIAIRTVVMAGGEAHVQAGAGVVFDSVADSEYEETVNKARALLLAVELAESGALGAGPVAAGEKGGAAP